MKKNGGITLVALTITIIVLIILSGITIKFGTDAIKSAKLESLKTNMLLLQGKLKMVAEEIKFKNPDKSDDELEQLDVEGVNKIQEGTNIAQKAKSAGIDDISKWYYFTKNQLEELGLKDIQEEEGDFIVKFDIKNATVNDIELVYTPGWNGSYTLKAINELEV